MTNWYRNMAAGQKVFLYVISILLLVIGNWVLPLAAVGLVCLLVLIFLQLGDVEKKGSSHH